MAALAITLSRIARGQRDDPIPDDLDPVATRHAGTPNCVVARTDPSSIRILTSYIGKAGDG